MEPARPVHLPVHLDDDIEVLRVYVGESARHQGRPVYELVVEEARSRGMAGATVLRGVAGFGAGSQIHTARILRLSEDLPMVVEIVDRADRIAAFLPHVDGLVAEGTITVHPVRAIFRLPLRIRDVMSPDVATVAPDTPVSRVVELLVRRGVKAVPVVEHGAILGIITGGDLLQRAGMSLRLDIHPHLPPDVRDEQARRLDLGGKLAKDVMTSPAATINVRASLQDAAKHMVRSDLKRLPVVDDTGTLAGIVSRVDILRTIGRVAAVSHTFPELPPGVKLTAADAMFTDVPTARPDQPLVEVLDLLVASPLRRVVVTGPDGTVLGLVLDRDLIKLYSRHESPGILRTLIGLLAPSPDDQSGSEPLAGRARDVMLTDLHTVPPDMPIPDVLQAMVETGAKRLVVTDPAGRLAGMVDRDRLLKLLAGGD